MYLLGAFLVSSLALISVNGEPQLTSTIESLSGVFCPSAITFNCNATDLDTSGLFEWFINDQSIASYTFRVGNQLPAIVMTDSSVLNATVMIISANFSNDIFSFEKVTLYTNLSDLVPVQGQHLSCGTFARRSNAISIGNFSFPGTALNVTIMASYEEKILKRIKAKWKNPPALVNCGIATDYVVELRNESDLLDTKYFNMSECIDDQCITRFFASNHDKYFLNVTATNMYDSYYFTSVEIGNSSSYYVNYSLSLDGCALVISCSPLRNGTCLARSNIQTDYINLNLANVSQLSGKILVDRVTPMDTYYIEIMVIYEEINVFLGINYTSGSANGENFLIGPTVFLFALGIVFLLVGYMLGILYWCKDQVEADICRIIVVWSIPSLLISISGFILWITFGVLSHDQCARKGTSESGVLIAAAALSCGLIIVSVTVMAGMIWAVNICQSKQSKLEKRRMVQFGAVEPPEQSICDNCRKCGACSKSICDDYNEKAYLKYCNGYKSVCKKCHNAYIREKNRLLSELPKFGSLPLNFDNYSTKCAECKRDTKPEQKNDTKGHSRMSNCESCGKWICEACLGGDVYLEYRNRECTVCANCYAIYCITTRNIHQEYEERGWIILERDENHGENNSSKGASKSEPPEQKDKSTSNNSEINEEAPENINNREVQGTSKESKVNQSLNLNIQNKSENEEETSV